ncbi:hypothetical protein ACFXTN_034256 [Malus domestica]
MLKECTNDGRMAIITKQRCVYSMIKACIGKYIFGAAQDIFKPFPIKLNEGGSSSSRQGAIPSYSSAMDTITKKLRLNQRVGTIMVQRVQDKNPRSAHLPLCSWSNGVYKLPRYLRRPRLNMHGVVFYGKNKCLRASQWRIKLQCRSTILWIAFLRKNGDGVVFKALKKHNDCNRKVSHKA